MLYMNESWKLILLISWNNYQWKPILLNAKIEIILNNTDNTDNIEKFNLRKTTNLERK